MGLWRAKSLKGDAQQTEDSYSAVACLKVHHFNVVSCVLCSKFHSVGHVQ
jgi:hypothetical protein